MKTQIKICWDMPPEEGELKIPIRLLRPYLNNDPESSWLLSWDTQLGTVGDNVCLYGLYDQIPVLRCRSYREANKALGILRTIKLILRANYGQI